MKKLMMQPDWTVVIFGNWSIRDEKTLHQTSVQNLDLMVKYSGTHRTYVISGDTISVKCIRIVKNKNFDTTNYNYVTERVAELKHQTVSNDDIVPVTLQELDDAVCQLSKGKACGDDEIDNEHIHFSGRNFRKLLVDLYNAMLLKSYIPISMKVRIIIPLYKGGTKPKDNPDSYRAITLTSCVLKLFKLLKLLLS